MDQLLGPLEEVFKDLKQKWRDMQEEQPLWDVIRGFLHAVDWTVSQCTKDHKMKQRLMRSMATCVRDVRKIGSED